jgi:uncharacterized protein (TIGR00369 family)
MRQDTNNAVHSRNRMIEWQDPAALREQADGLSFLDRIRPICDGKLSPTPIARMIGSHYGGAEPGEIVIELQLDHALVNPAGAVHAGVAAARLDVATSGAAGTLLPVDKGAVTFDLKISFLKPLAIESGPIRALGRVVDLAGPTSYVTGQIHDGERSLVVPDVGVVSAITSKQTPSSDPRDISNKPGICSAIWRTLLELMAS